MIIDENYSSVYVKVQNALKSFRIKILSPVHSEI